MISKYSTSTFKVPLTAIVITMGALISLPALAQQVTVTITTPSYGELFYQNQPVHANFNCSPGPSGSPITSCVGDIEYGELLDTSTLGSHTFSVTCTDQEGHQLKKLYAYTVVAP
ncbi:MAG: hypothetical protein GY702_23160 [Desulfobulbaceae bacterium]|nr:hypothetical protein [Desulfobulbaceae bacterium]